VFSDSSPVDFVKKIIFSGYYVKKQNCQIWGNENPRISMEKQMHPQRVTVWSGFWAGRVITEWSQRGSYA